MILRVDDIVRCAPRQRQQQWVITAKNE
jgi:hypothetical protein